MHIKNGVKIYDTREDIEADYENFVKEWQYNVNKESGVHSSGLQLCKEYLDSEAKIVYTNLHEWANKMKESGLSAEDIHTYRKTLNNQFVIINEKNPTNHARSNDSQMTEDDRKRHIELLKIGGKKNGKTDEEINQMIANFNRLADEKLSKNR